MGYSPDAQARSLVVGRTQTIGVVVTAITDPFIARVVQGIENTALDQGYSVILASSNSEPEREIAAVEMLRSKRVDGVIVTSSRVGARYQEHLDRLGVPVVLINNRRQQMGPYTYSVAVDNRHGAFVATEHLLHLGHRRIAYVTGPAESSDSLERLEGYRHALGKAGVTPDPTLVLAGNGRLGGGERAFVELMRLEESATAVFCYNDVTAIGLLCSARKAGIPIPRNLALVGFDDIPMASYVHPSLTTIAQPMTDMGRRAMVMVLDLLGDPNPSASNMSDIVVQGKLVVRLSSDAMARSFEPQAGHGAAG
jgi:DNA-binding LacI/PurR family transcriptional regulator